MVGVWCVLCRGTFTPSLERVRPSIKLCEDSSPSAYPHLSSNALDDLSYDCTTVVQQTLSHPSLHPSNLGILPRKKAWLLNLDITVLSDAGNIYDVMFMAARAALWDTKVPRTRGVQYARVTASKNADSMDVEQEGVPASGFDTRQVPSATDFELPDYWDEGEMLAGRDTWPVCLTLNIVSCVLYMTTTALDRQLPRSQQYTTWMPPLRRRHRHHSGSFSCTHFHYRSRQAYKEQDWSARGRSSSHR